MMSARSAACFFIVAVAMEAAAVGATGKTTSPPPSASGDCSTLVMQMTDCLGYVTNATVAKPEGNCCSGFKTVLKTNPDCLCQVYKSSAQFGITVNVTKAASLPSACHVHALSVAKCGASLSPSGAPVGGPSGSPTANPPSSGGELGVPPAAAPAVKGSSTTTRISTALAIALIAGAFFSSY